MIAQCIRTSLATMGVDLIKNLFLFAVKRSINVECRVWAKNVIYRGGMRDRQGSVNFILLID